MFISDEGQGRAVLLLHGCLLPPAYFGSLTETLLGERRVLVPYLPGYTPSPMIDGEYTLERVTALLADELQRLGITELDIVAHSLGTYRALALALSGRVVVGTLLGWGGFAGLDPEAARMFGAVANGFRTGAVTWETLFHSSFAPGFIEAHPSEADACRQLATSVPAPVAATEFDARIANGIPSSSPTLRPQSMSEMFT